MIPEPVKKVLINPLFIILAAGLAVRLILAPMFADYSDFSFWAGISFDVREEGSIYRDYDLWYPPVWGYVISAFSPLLDLFGCTPLEGVVDEASSIGYAVGDGWIPSPAAVFVIKLPIIISDVLCGFFIHSIVLRISDDRRKALLSAALWTFCPLTIYVSAVQGQFDSIQVLLVILAVWSYLNGSYFPAGAFVALSVLTKPFSALIVLPLLALIITYEYGNKRHVKSALGYIAGGLVMTAFVCVPIILNGETQFLTGFMSNRYSSGFPLPSGFSMSMLPVSESFGLAPSGSNMNTFFFLSILLSLMLSVFILARGKLKDSYAVLIVLMASCLHLIWYPATGYVQYYVMAIAALAVASSVDVRFRYLAYAVTVLALIPAFWGFNHAYQLYEYGWVSVDALENAYSTMRSIFDIPDTIASHLKFLPMLLAVVLSAIILRRDAVE